MENNLVVVGCYYFKQGAKLISALETQFQRGKSLKGEYFLSDTINIMIELGLKMRTQSVAVWLDTGTIDATLLTNRYLLEHSRLNKKSKKNISHLTILDPVVIHPSARISNSVIGPYASIGAGCTITGSKIEDSIIEAGATVDAAALTGSFIGRKARVQGISSNAPPLKLNIGDDSSVSLI